MLPILLRSATCAWACIALSAWAQQPVDLGFETPSVTGTDRPWGWEDHWQWGAGTSAMDSATVRGGRYSFRLSAADTSAGGAHAMMLRLPAGSLQGHVMELTAHVRTGTGAYRIYLNTWGVPGAQDSVAVETPATQDWTTATLSVPIGAQEYQLVLTLVATRGTVWFDELVLTADGQAVTALPSGPPPTGVDLDVLRAHCTVVDPLREPVPGTWPPGYEAIDRIVGQAQVVSLGESTHGTHEFFVAKHRLFQYLVEKQGFTVFAIEANQLTTERINAYVHGSKDTVEKTMGGLFGVWYKQEVKDLIEWMRDYNGQKPDRPLSFAGFDMQDPQAPMDSVVAYVRRTDPRIADVIQELYADQREAWRKSDYPQPMVGQGARWFQNAREAYALLTGYVLDRPPADPAAQLWLIQNARVVMQCASQANDPWNSGIRDSCMAANIAWTLQQHPAGTRMAVWAHDGHVGRIGFANGTNMGAHMVRAFGDRLRVIGLGTYAGAYRATRSFRDHRTMDARCFPAPAGSLEEAMHRVLGGKGEALLLDVRAAATDTRSTWLAQPRPVRSIGYSAFDFGFEQPTTLADQFDAVLLIDQTTPSRSLE